MPDERMVYESMDAMAKAFQDAQKQLDNTKSATMAISKKLGDGALQGKGGAAFQHAIEGPLQKKLGKLSDLMKDLEKDIKNAVERNKKVVKDSSKGF
jgi:uncharacterized protein YukE